MQYYNPSFTLLTRSIEPNYKFFGREHTPYMIYNVYLNHRLWTKIKKKLAVDMLICLFFYIPPIINFVIHFVVSSLTVFLLTYWYHS
jgi:hypothetical protein